MIIMRNPTLDDLEKGNVLIPFSENLDVANLVLWNAHGNVENFMACAPNQLPIHGSDVLDSREKVPGQWCRRGRRI